MDGWIQIHGWLASRPALFFEKPGQPTMYLDPPIHFWCIFIGIGTSLDVFSILWGVFSLLWD